MERENDYRRAAPAISSILAESSGSDILDRQMIDRIDQDVEDVVAGRQRLPLPPLPRGYSWVETLNETGAPLAPRVRKPDGQIISPASFKPYDLDQGREAKAQGIEGNGNRTKSYQNYQYGVILPFRRAINDRGEYIDEAEWAVPMVLQSLYDTVMLPGRALRGEDITQREITEAALNMAGGSVVRATATKSRGLLLRGTEATEQAVQAKMLEQANAAARKAAARQAEYEEYLRLRRTPEEASYWIEDYPTNLAGHHFFKRKWGRYLKIPSTIMNSRFNVLKPEDISRGRMAKRHVEVDPEYNGGKFPARAGGQRWSAEEMGWETRSLPGRLWYGSPRPLKIAVGVGTPTIVGTGTGAYYYFKDDQALTEPDGFVEGDLHK